MTGNTSGSGISGMVDIYITMIRDNTISDKTREFFIRELSQMLLGFYTDVLISSSGTEKVPFFEEWAKEYTGMDLDFMSYLESPEQDSHLDEDQDSISDDEARLTSIFNGINTGTYFQEGPAISLIMDGAQTYLLGDTNDGSWVLPGIDGYSRMDLADAQSMYEEQKKIRELEKEGTDAVIAEFLRNQHYKQAQDYLLKPYVQNPEKMYDDSLISKEPVHNFRWVGRPLRSISEIKEISDRLEQSILDRDEEGVKKWAAAAYYANCEFPRAAGLAARYLRPSLAVHVLYATSRQVILDSSTWPEPELAKALHLYEIKFDNHFVDQLFCLLPLAEDIHHPSFFGSWPDIDLPALEKLEPASVQERSLNAQILLHLDQKWNDNVPYTYKFLNMYARFQALLMLGQAKPKEQPYFGTNQLPELASEQALLITQESYDSNKLFLMYLQECPDSFVQTVGEGFLKNPQFLTENKAGEYLMVAMQKAPGLIQSVFDTKRTALSRLGYGRLLIDKKQSQAFPSLLENNIFNTAATRNKLLEYAREKGEVEIQAAIMDYIDRTTDPIKEAEKQMKKEMALLSAKPGSVTFMKQLWSWSQQQDGTLILNSYKGPAAEVIEVPARIGKRQVSALGKNVFSPRNTYFDLAWAADGLKHVILPEGITEIATGTFSENKGLELLVMPSTLRYFSTYDFYHHSRLDLWFAGDLLKDRKITTRRSYLQVSGPKMIHAPAGSNLARVLKMSHQPRLDCYPAGTRIPQTLQEAQAYVPLSIPAASGSKQSRSKKKKKKK